MAAIDTRFIRVFGIPPKANIKILINPAPPSPTSTIKHELLAHPRPINIIKYQLLAPPSIKNTTKFQ
jgi:hypothetical protein